MRREDDVGVLAQAIVVERLALDDVEARGGDVAGVEGLEEGVLVDDGPRAVLIRYEPGRIRASVRALIRWRLAASR